MGTLSWWIEMDGAKRVHLALGCVIRFVLPEGFQEGCIHLFSIRS
jgi:hypothetical protein